MFRAFWLRGSKTQPKQSRRPAPSPRRARFELLEDRLNLSASVFTVTNSSDQLAPGSLRFAIAEANLPGNQGSTVLISSEVTGPINLTHGELKIEANMTIENQSGAPLVIDQLTPGARVFHITGSRGQRHDRGSQQRPTDDRGRLGR